MSEGAEYSRNVYIPMKQGVLWTGIIKAKVKVNLNIVHHSTLLTKEVEFYVWDMGADLTLSNAFLEDNWLLPATAGPQDDAILRATFETRKPGWGQKEKDQRADARSITNHVQAEPEEEGGGAACRKLQNPQGGAAAGVCYHAFRLCL